jgi:hypothetical protein
MDRVYGIYGGGDVHVGVGVGILRRETTRKT